MAEEFNFEEFQRSLDELQEKFGIGDRALSDFVKGIKGQTKDFKKAIQDLNKEIDRGKKGYKEQVDMLEQLDQAIEALTDTVIDENDVVKRATRDQEKARLIAQRDALQTSASMRGFQEATAEATTKMGTSLVQGAGQFVKGLQANSSGMDLAAGIMTAGVDVAVAGTQGLGKAAQSVAPALMMLGPWGMAAGAALSVLGIAAEKSAETVGKLAKFGIEVLQKEVEKTVKAFHDMSGAGAMFTRGMDDMRIYSRRAGLTTDQFAGAVKNSAPLLAQAGYTVSDGAKIMANVTSQFAKTTGRSGMTLQREMQNLGFGFQEQAELSAMIISDLRRTGTGSTTSNKAVAEATLDLAKNMRVVANIQGEEAKQRMDQAKKQAEQYAFFAKVNEIARRTNDPGLPKRVEASLALMDETQRRAAIQATVLEGAVTDVGANLTGAADGGREFADSLNRGGAKVTDMVGGFARQGDQYLKATDEVGRAVSMAAIATGKNAELAESFSSQGQQSLKLNSDNLKKAVDQADKSAGATGTLQDGVMGAEKAAQDLKIALETELTPAILKFADVSKNILQSVQSMLDEMGLGDPARKAREAKQEKDLEKKYEEKYGGFAKSRLAGDKAAYERKQNREAEIAKMTPEEAAEARKRDARMLELSKKQGYKDEPTIYEQMIKEGKIVERAKGGPISTKAITLVGEKGPELILGEGNVLSNADTETLLSALQDKKKNALTGTDTETLIKVLDSLREMKGIRFGENDFQAQVGMQAERMATIKDRIKGFEGFDYTQLQEELNRRPEMADMAAARSTMMAGEDQPSTGVTQALHEQSAILVRILNTMSDNNRLTSGILQNSY